MKKSLSFKKTTVDIICLLCMLLFVYAREHLPLCPCQGTAKNLVPKIGYTLNAQGACNIQVNYDTGGSQTCRLNDTSGPQAFGKNAQGNCNEVWFRPVN